MASLLLDTEAFIWWDANDARLGGSARLAIQNADEVFVSAVSAWEISIKAALGKLRTTRRPSLALAESGFREVPVSFAHAEAVRSLPQHHRDPFDRLLIATAKLEGLAILSSDDQFYYYDIDLIDARG